MACANIGREALLSTMFSEQTNFGDGDFSLVQKVDEHDPVLRIASIFSRGKSLNCSRLFTNVFKYGPSVDSASISFDASSYALFEYLGSGLNIKGVVDNRSLGEIMTTYQDDEQMINKISLMRLAKSVLINHKHRRERSDSRNIVGTRYSSKANLFLKLDVLANNIADALYEQIAVWHYSKGWEFERMLKRGPKKKSLDLLLDPKSVVAANVLYPYLVGFEDAIHKSNSRFDLNLLICGKFYICLSADEETKSCISRALNGPKSMINSFYESIIFYQLSRLEGLYDKKKNV